MYNPGTAVLNAINDFKLQARITGTVNGVAFTDANIVGGSFSINNQCSSDTELLIGQVYVGELNITLTGVSWDRYTLYGKQITAIYQLYVEGSGWVPIPLGTYNISEVEVTNAGIDIRAYDNMSKFDVSFTANALSGTPYALASAACTACGLTLATTQTQFNAFANHGVTLTATQTTDVDGNKSIPQFSTYRDVIAAIAQISCCNVLINRSGEVVFKPYPSTAVATIDTAHRKMGGMTADFETYYDGIIVTDPTTKAQTKYTRSNPTGLTMDLGDNPFINTTAIRNAILNGLTFRFHPFKMSVLNAPLYDLMDCVYLPDGVGDGTKLYCITKYNWTYHGSYTISGTGQDPKLVSVTSAAQRTAARANFIAAQKITSDEMDAAIDAATAKITGNSGGYVVLHDTDNDGEPDELLVMNTPSISTATKVWRWNQSGLGYSSTGYSGSYGLAMTDDGDIVANRIRVGVLGDEAGLNSWDMTNGAFRLRSSDGFTDINLTGDSNGSYISVTDTTSYARATLRGKAGSLILSHSEDNGATYTEVGSVWVNGGSGTSNANIDRYRVGRYGATTGDLINNQTVARWDYTANKSYIYGNEIYIHPDAGVYNQTTAFSIAKWNSNLSTTEIRAGLYSFKSPDAVFYPLVDWDTTKTSAGTHLYVSYATMSEAGITTVNATTINATTAQATTFRTVNGEAIAWSSATGDSYVRAYEYQIGNEASHKTLAWLSSDGTTANIRAGYYSFAGPSSNYQLISWDTTQSTPGTHIYTSYGTIGTINSTTINSKTVKATTFRTVNDEAMSWSSETGNTYVRAYNYQVGNEANHMPLAGWDTTLGTVVDAGQYRIRKVPDDGTYSIAISRDSNNNLLFDSKTPVYTTTKQTISGTKTFLGDTYPVIRHNTAGYMPSIQFANGLNGGDPSARVGMTTDGTTGRQSRVSVRINSYASSTNKNISHYEYYHLPAVTADMTADKSYNIITTKNLTDIPDASATVRGMVSTGEQTFAGTKIFTAQPHINTAARYNVIYFKQTNNTATNTYDGCFGFDFGNATTPSNSRFYIEQGSFKSGAATGYQELYWFPNTDAGLTADKNYYVLTSKTSGVYKSASNSSAISLPSSTTTNLLSISITKGIWIISASVRMHGGGASGTIRISISDTSLTTQANSNTGFSEIDGSASYRTANGTRIYSTSSTKTIYLVASQDSGSAKTIDANQCMIRAVCLSDNYTAG